MTPEAVPAAKPEPDRRGPRRATTARSAELPGYLPARMLNEFVYCPRLFFYEWVEGVFADSADTVQGSLRHEKLETRKDALPAPADEGRIHSRSVTLSVKSNDGRDSSAVGASSSVFSIPENARGPIEALSNRAGRRERARLSALFGARPH